MNDEIKATLKKSYDANAQLREKSEMQEWKVGPRAGFLKLVLNEQKKTLLEIGAGHGRDSRFFADNGLDVTAIDLSPEMVKLCREKSINAYEMDFYDLGRLGIKYDAVWAMNTLLHVEKAHLGAVLDEIKKVLVPGGLFYMGVFGGRDFEGVWEEDTYEPKRFYAYYTDEKIKSIVSGHFDLVEFEKIATGRTIDFQSITMRNR